MGLSCIERAFVLCHGFGLTVFQYCPYAYFGVPFDFEHVPNVYLGFPNGSRLFSTFYLNR